MSDRLSKHARPALDDARLARQWAVIARTPRRRALGPLAATAVLAAALASLVTWRVERARAAPPASPPVATELDADGASTLVLADGSRIATGGRARLVLEETTSTTTRVSLLAGAADFDVKHDPARTFVVTAHGVSIVDTGTRFHVEYTDSADHVRVVVIEGSVRLDRPGSAPANLVAGDTWASGEATPAVASASAAASADGPSVDAASELPNAPPADDFARFAAIAERDPNAAFAVFGESGYPRAIERATPRQLFELGDAARLSGHPVQAADAFDALRLRHRDDPRAGLAALQVARLKQDTLRDPAGAEAALRDAIALAPDPGLREDAEARRVAALEAMNDLEACAQARNVYLAKYPAGVHRASVEKRCRGR